jgi:uncharacterized protein (DUF362 family)
MTTRITRRDVLARGLGTAGLLAGGLPRAWAAQLPASKPVRRPDQSAQAPALPVAIQRCESYEPQALRRTLDEALNLIGGIKKLVENKTVTVKLNLTGGQAGKIGGLEPYQTYHDHPKMVAAVCASLCDAGAKRIILVESMYSLKPPEEFLADLGWNVREIKSAGGNRVEIIDTRNRGPFPKYVRLEVPGGGRIFPAFDLSPAYDKTDVFVSLAKMKDHIDAGVTMTVKNLFGITPLALYGDGAPADDAINARSGMLHHGVRTLPAGVPGELAHGYPAKDWQHRVPGITADLFMTRPCDLGIIDGVETNRGGEGPWCKIVEPVQPKLLFVGRNGVCADAICAAAMGYDPLADHNQFPFPGDNLLKLLAASGVGTNDPKRIEVRGLALQKAIFPFNPEHRQLKQPLAYYHWDCARHGIPALV